jgi:hypothetical protein
MVCSLFSHSSRFSIACVPDITGALLQEMLQCALRVTCLLASFCAVRVVRASGADVSTGTSLQEIFECALFFTIFLFVVQKVMDGIISGNY